MTEAVDPLRFLNLKKKRQTNRQRTDLKRTLSKQQSFQQTSRFLLPSFSSQNSLDYEEKNKIKKVYNPMKYFNPQIENYLTKLNRIKIANAPMISNVQIKKPNNINNIQVQNKDKTQDNFVQTFKNQPNQMMTFAKNLEFGCLASNQTKTTFNFFKPGLKKSGSMKMMEKMQQTNPNNIQIKKVNTQEGISPWQLPQYAQQEQQLHQCEICNRKFNQKSYSKHVKVCQKVFFQKRKPFNSRQNSLEKNTKK